MDRQIKSDLNWALMDEQNLTEGTKKMKGEASQGLGCVYEKVSQRRTMTTSKQSLENVFQSP